MTKELEAAQKALKAYQTAKALTPRPELIRLKEEAKRTMKALRQRMLEGL